MAIAALVLWVLTAAAGVAVLVTGNAARRAAVTAAAPVPFPAPVPVPVPARPGPPGTGELREIPKVTVHARPGDHPLLEFSHPALGVLGMGFWFIYVGTHHAPMAWISFGVLMAAIAAGLIWLGRNTRARRRSRRPVARARFAPRMVLLHGAAAAGTLALAVLTALSATH